MRNKLTGGSVKITGPNTYGSTLTANVTPPSPTPDSYTYQWYYTDTPGATTGGTTNYSASYDANTHYATVKVTSPNWNGSTIVSGESTSYGQNVTTAGVVNNSYNLKPGYSDYTNGAKTVYY